MDVAVVTSERKAGQAGRCRCLQVKMIGSVYILCSSFDESSWLSMQAPPATAVHKVRVCRESRSRLCAFIDHQVQVESQCLQVQYAYQRSWRRAESGSTRAYQPDSTKVRVLTHTGCTTGMAWHQDVRKLWQLVSLPHPSGQHYGFRQWCLLAGVALCYMPTGGTVPQWLYC